MCKIRFSFYYNFRAKLNLIDSIPPHQKYKNSLVKEGCKSYYYLGVSTRFNSVYFFVTFICINIKGGYKIYRVNST